MTKNKSKAIFIATLIICAILKIYIVQVQPIKAGYSLKYDDQLMVNLANNILEGKWLGEYNKSTLIKGVFTPLFIALQNKIGIPFLIGKEILYIIACIALTIALKNNIKNRVVLVIIFNILLWNPVEFCSDLCRVYRDGIYLSLLLILIATLIVIFNNREERIKKQIKYYTFFGITFSCTYLCREETIWIIPGIMFLILAMELPLVLKKKYSSERILLYIIPIAIWVISTNIICCINYKNYGIYTLNQYWGKEFKSAYGSLTRVLPQNEIDRVPVTMEVMQRLYKLSPKLKELEPFFEGDKGRGWSKTGEKIENEINGGYFHWALMDAVESRGYYKDAQTANQYYKELGNEINKICDDGNIEIRCNKRISNTCYFDVKDILRVVSKMYETIMYQYSLKNVDTLVINSSSVIGLEDSKSKKELFESITGHKIVEINHYYETQSNNIKLKALGIIKRIYTKVNPIMFYSSILMYIVLIIINIKSFKQIYDEFIILTFFIIIYLSRIFVITFTYQLMFKEALNVPYLSCIYNVQYIFSVLACTYFIKDVYKRIRRKKYGINSTNTMS